MVQEEALGRLKVQTCVAGKLIIEIGMISLLPALVWPASIGPAVETRLFVEREVAVEPLAKEFPHVWVWFAVKILTVAYACHEGHRHVEMLCNGPILFL